jgi:CDP-2,3-bis-(O-geranylgeranyl)-sn-glycerol synthase
MQLLCEIVWYVLPAGFANMAPVFAAKAFPRWSTPVDLGARLGGVRIFGDHKTVRGVVAGVLVGTLVCLGQVPVFESSAWIRSISIVDYARVAWVLGPLLAIGALLGDVVKSFFKRRLRRPPGRTWFPYDQIDWMVGALAVTYPIASPRPGFVLVAILASVALSVVVKLTGHALRIDEKPI